MPSHEKQIHWSLLLHVAFFALAFALQLALARWAVDPAVFGIYVFYLSLAQTLAMIADLGIPAASLRFISRHLAHRQVDAARRLAGRAYRIILTSDLVVAGLLIVGVLLVRKGVQPQMWLAAAMIPLWGLRFMNESWAKSQHRTTLTLFPGGILHPMLVLGSCYLLFGLRADVAGSVQLLTVVCIVVGICGLGQAAWLFGSKVRFPENDQEPDADLEPPGHFTLRELLRVSLPMLLVTGLAIAMSHCDVLMLKWLASDAETGKYAVAVRISWLIALPLMAVNLLAAPTYASLWELRNIEAMRDKARVYSGYIIAGTIPLACGLFIGGKVILGWHGEAYLVSYLPLVILLGGQLINNGVGSTALLLSMTGHQDVVAKVFAPCAILNIVANAVLIPRMGATGAAITTAVSLSLWNLALIVIIWRTLKLDTSWLNLLPGAKGRFSGQLPVFEG